MHMHFSCFTSVYHMDPFFIFTLASIAKEIVLQLIGITTMYLDFKKNSAINAATFYSMECGITISRMIRHCSPAS